MNLTQEQILIEYQSNIVSLQKEIDAQKKKINGFSFLRLAVFVLAIVLFYLLFNFGVFALITWSITMIIIFLWIIKHQATLQETLDFNIIKQQLHQNEIAVFHLKGNIYDAGITFENSKHPYTDDLDIFGENSLFALLNRTATLEGNEILAGWLKNAASKQTIISRQAAIQELAKQQQENLNFRTQLYPLKGIALAQLKLNIKEKLPSLTHFINAKYIPIILTFLPSLSFSLLLAAVFYGGILWSILGLSLLINYLVYAFHLKEINQVHLLFSQSAKKLKILAEIIKPIAEQPWKGLYLTVLMEKIKNKEGDSTHEQIKKLSEIIENFDTRLNVFVGTLLNLFLFWDLRMVKKLNKWQEKSSRTMINSFDVIAEFEALISLANLDYNHPDWVYPEISASYFFRADVMGHPLIPAQERVNNAFQFSEQMTVDVITGSNMAGKSTFLRTIGINMVLAYAGAKVCATHFETSVFFLVSYMRIKDSLMDQTSTFKAELDRLKMILSLTEENENTFVLVDEMLRGTNSKDKYLGTKVFIEKLVSQQMPGLIATHDLQIAELEKNYPAKVRNFHFDITMKGEEMFFDYLVKNGECKTFNAAILLKAIGLSLGKM